MASSEVLSAPLVLEYPFRRTTGAVQGAFLTGLRDGRVLGIRATDGRVLCPPVEYDPVTGDELTELVELGTGGEVTTWSWEPEPRPNQPLDRPFAWALVRLDGADTAMLHAVDAVTPDAMSTGMRVRVRWAPVRAGGITDIACFEPEGAGGEGEPPAPPEHPVDDTVKLIETPARLDYTFTAGTATTRFLKGIAEKRILGERCGVCGKVYVPPRGSCPTDGVATTEQVELPDRGIVTTFCVVNLQFYGQAMEVPYVCATVLLDGADIGLFGLVQEIPFDQVRMGMRVEAVWVDDAELGPTMTNIRWWKPTGEPDAPYESFREHV
jgi:uncharacterized OB-fold protein